MKEMKCASAAVLALLLLFSALSASALPHETFSPAVFIDPVLALQSGDAGASGETARIVTITYRDGMSGAGKESVDLLGVFHHDYSMLPMTTALVSPDQINVLRTVPEVAGIYHEETFETYLDKSASYIGANVVWNTYGDTGKGTAVLIIDTGIDGTHPDIRDKLVQNAIPSRTGGLVTDYIENVPNSDLDGHGTHVCGIVAGIGYAFGPNLPAYHKYRGIAYGASIIGFGAGYDPTAANATLELSALLEGFNYALAKKDEYGIKAISNSWGSSGDFDPKSPIAQASFECYKKGIAVFFAAGNEGPGEHTMNRHSMAPWVLAVAAGDYMNNIAEFSSRGTDGNVSGFSYDHPDITAPGAGITSCKALLNSNVNIIKASSETALYATMSGTSMACPHVAGVAALLFSANPELSPDQVYDIITATASPMRGHSYWEAGAGYINALEAYRLATKTEGNADAFLAGEIKYGGASTGDFSYSQDPVSVGYGKQSSATMGGANYIVVGDLAINANVLIAFAAIGAVLLVISFKIKK